MASSEWMNPPFIDGVRTEQASVLLPHPPANLEQLPAVLRDKVPKPGQNPAPTKNIFMWEQKDMVGQQYWMRTQTTQKAIAVTVADKETRDLRDQEKNLTYRDELFYDCQAHALRTWIPTQMETAAHAREDGSLPIKEGTRQGYRIRLDCLWDVLHDPGLAKVIYEEGTPGKDEAHQIDKGDVLVLWKRDSPGRNEGRDGIHAAIIVKPEWDSKNMLSAATLLSTKNGFEIVKQMTMEELKACSHYFEDNPLLGVYELTEATTFL